MAVFLRPDTVLDTFHQLLKDAGLPTMRFHDLRHSAATILFMAGVNPKVIQELLGHSKISITLLLIVIGVIFTILSGYVVNSIDINPAFKPFALPALIIVTCILCIVALCQYFLQQNPQDILAKISSQNRLRLLAKVRNIWITGYLKHSLHGAALIALGLQERKDLLADPWRLMLQQPDHEPLLLSAHTPIIQVYDSAAGELLILGAPGSGKTTLLLELTCDLLDRAEKDEMLPMPLVFNLSSWALKRPSLADWLVEEMNIRYQIPRKLGQNWVNSDQVLPLLDGLNEVALSHREACVNAINVYRAEHGLSSMVVCSRTADYEFLSSRLRLQRAVVVQPLTDAQIDEYIANTQGQLEAVRAALHDDSSLRELAAIPLMLGVLTLAYHGRQKEILLKSDSLETRREQIFREYAYRMFLHGGVDTYFTQEQKIGWLSWLAWQLKQHNQSDFYLERMQSDWLPMGYLRRLYSSIVAGLACGVTLGLMSGGIFLALGLVEVDQALTFGMLIGFLSMLMGVLNIRPVIVIAAGVLVGAGMGAFYGPQSIQHTLLGGMLFGIFIGTSWGGITCGLMYYARAEIQPAEVLVWSWTKVQQGRISILIVALILGLQTPTRCATRCTYQTKWL